MHNVITRAITATLLCIIGLLIYFFAPPYIITALLIILATYILLFEYRPLFNPKYKASFLSLILIIGGFGALLCFGHIFLIVPFIFAMIADTSAYIIGNLFGRHHIAPTISPKKTWEGFIGSCICTAIGAIVLFSFIGNDQLYNATLNDLFIFMLLGCGCAIAGFLGDLCISQLKRNAGVKDTGTLLPGHGGLLDRLDSVLAIALFLFFL